MTYMIPPNDRADGKIYRSDYICKSTQQTANQTLGSPMLQTEPGSRVLLMYQENGHITLPEASPNKPTPGTVYVYGTDMPYPHDTLLNIHGVWNKNGTAGDKRGRLLSTAPFDDGSCYQINSSKESLRRQDIPQRLHKEDEGENLWCGTVVKLPEHLPHGSNYTFYWVWDWPSKDDSGGLIKPQIYTTCVDVHVV